MMLETEKQNRLNSALKAFVSFRIVFLGMMLFSSWILTKFYQDPPSEAVWRLGRTGFLFSGFSLALYWIAGLWTKKSWMIRQGIVWLQIAWDLWVATQISFIAGNAGSAVTLLYSLYILMATAMLDVPGAVISALGAMSLYTYGIFKDLPWESFRDPRELTRTLFVVSVLALLGGILGWAARNKQRISDLLNRARVDLEDLSRLHSAIIEHIPSGLMVVSQRTGKVSLVNEASIRILGEDWTGKDLLNSPLNFFADKASRSESVLKIGGTERVLGHSRTDLPGRGILVIFQDLTEIRDLETRIQTNEKLASIGQLAAGIAHEIRNPLASLSGSIQLLKNEIPSESQPEKLMKIVLRETDRLDALIKNFLNYAKPAQLRLEKVYIQKALHEILELIKNHRALDFSEISIKVQLTEELWVICDPSQLRQILWNLILNAIDALEGSGELLIRGNEIKKDAEELVHLEIEDSGAGIPDNLLNRVFDPFFTTKSEGTGLGLALVYQMVKAHGGQIGIESKTKVGTKVWLDLLKHGPKQTEVRAA